MIVTLKEATFLTATVSRVNWSAVEGSVDKEDDDKDDDQIIDY